MIPPGLGRAVGAPGVQGPILGKAARVVQGERAVDFVSGHVHEAALPVAVPGPAGRFQESVGAQHVGAHKSGRVLDAAVHVAFGREVHHRVSLLHEGQHRLGIADVAAHDAQPIGVLCLQIGQVQGVARIGQQVQVDHAVFGVVGQNMADEVGAYEAVAAGYQ